MRKRVLRIALLLLIMFPAMKLTARTQREETVAQFGVPVTGAQTLDLSGLWRVKEAAFLDDKMTQLDFDDHDWRMVNVPARWKDQGIEPAAGIPKVAIYRRTFSAPDSWAGKPIGVAAWLFPKHSTVTLNGSRVEPSGEAPWFYADVTDLLNKSGDNVLVVSTQFDGIYEMALPNPPRVGPLDTWQRSALTETALTPEINGEALKATLYTQDSSNPRPAVLMVGTGSHGLGFTEPFIPIARELAYAGYVTMPIALIGQTPENINQVIEYLKKRPEVDPTRIAVIAGVASAVPVLEQIAAQQSLAAVVTLSTKDAPGAKGLTVPVLLIATERDQTGPSNIYARRVAESLAGPHETLILPGTENGMGILDSGWNPVRQSILGWFRKYLATTASH